MWLAEEANRCPTCGTYSWQWKYQDEEGVWRRHPEDQIPIAADYETCLGCKEREDLWAAATHDGQAPPHGMKVRWMPKELIDD